MDKEEIARLLGDSDQAEPSTQFSEQAARVQSALPVIGAPVAPSIAGRATPRKAQEEFIAQHQQPGMPMDVESGLPTWQNLMLEFRRSRENKLRYLESKYGEDNIRMTPDGEMFVKIPDPANPNKQKELLVSPHGKVTLDDFLNLSAAIPEVAGWIAAEKMAVKTGLLAGKKLLPSAGRLGVAAVGAETAGALTKDIPTSLYDTGIIDVPEILRGRGEQAAADVGVGAVAGGAGRMFRFLRSPAWGARQQMQIDAEAGREHLFQKFGVRVPLTIGESTGIPFAMRTEAFVEKEPGGSGPIRRIKSEQEEALRHLQRLMMGRDVPLDEEVGQKAVQEIYAQTKPISEAVETARGATAGAAQSSIEGMLSGLTSADREWHTAALGKDIREAIVSRRDAEKAEADRLYGIVRSLPGGTGKVFEGAPLQARFEEILKSLPSALATKESIVYDQYGNAMTRKSREQQLLEKWPPDKLLSRLREITGLKEPKFALSDLQQMRRDIYDDIQKGEGAPGLGVHYLAQIGNAITGFLKDSIANLPEGKLKTALEAADKQYRERVVPFNRIGLTELFRATDEPGFVPNNQVVSRVFSGGDAYRNWQLMKETLGETSNPFVRLKRAVADNLVPREPGEETIQAKEFARNLYQFSRQHREIYEDIFTPQERELFRQARVLKYAQGDTLDAKELEKLLQSPHPTSAQLNDLVQAERRKSELFKNEIVKAVGSGRLDESTLRPTEFVSRLLANPGFSVQDTQKITDLIRGNPQLVNELRQKTFEKIFRDAARPATAEDITRRAAGDNTHILSGILLNQALKDRTYREKVALVLGPEAFSDLNAYIKLTAPLEAKEEAYSLAGGLAAGSRVGQLERVLEGRGGLLKFAGNTARSFVFSWLLSNPASRWYLGEAPGANALSQWYKKNVPLELEDARALAVTILSSPPFLQAAAREFPGASGARFINEIRDSIQRTVGGQQKPQSTSPDRDSERLQYWRKKLGEPNLSFSPGRGYMRPQLKPAIRAMGGRIIQGNANEVHNDIIARNRLSPEEIDQRGFVDEQGRWYDRERAAAARPDLPTQNEPGRLHSTDLP